MAMTQEELAAWLKRPVPQKPNITRGPLDGLTPVNRAAVMAGADQFGQNRNYVQQQTQAARQSITPDQLRGGRTVGDALRGAEWTRRDPGGPAGGAHQDLANTQGRIGVVRGINSGMAITRNPLELGLTAQDFRNMGGQPNYAGMIPPDVANRASGRGPGTMTRPQYVPDGGEQQRAQFANESLQAGIQQRGPAPTAEQVRAEMLTRRAQSVAPPVAPPQATQAVAPATSPPQATQATQSVAPPDITRRPGQRADESSDQFNARLAEISERRAFDSPVARFQREQELQRVARTTPRISPLDQEKINKLRAETELVRARGAAGDSRELATLAPGQVLIDPATGQQIAANPLGEKPIDPLKQAQTQETLVRTENLKRQQAYTPFELQELDALQSSINPLKDNSATLQRIAAINAQAEARFGQSQQQPIDADQVVDEYLSTNPNATNEEIKRHLASMGISQ